MTDKQLVNRNMQPWGSSQVLNALADRWKRLVPGGDELSHDQALAAAQAALLWGANPFSGQIRAWITKEGKLVIMPGYTLIVNWANTKSPFIRKFEKMTGHGVPKRALAYKCSILRVDTMPVFNAFTAGGADYLAAFDLCAIAAIGMVKPDEMFDEEGNPIPTGLVNWSWDDAAQKRALLKAIRQGYGYPTIAEIAILSWGVDGTVTDEDDWETAWEEYPTGTDEDRAQVAALSARTCQALEKLAELSPEQLAQELANANLMLHPAPADI